MSCSGSLKKGRFGYQWQAALAMVGPIYDTSVESTIFTGNGRCTIISIFIKWVHLHFNTKWNSNFISTIAPLRISRRKVDNNSENPSAKSFERELTLAPYLCQPDIKHIDYLFSLWDWGAWVIKGLLYHPFGLPYKFTTITALVFKSSRQKTLLHT